MNILLIICLLLLGLILVLAEKTGKAPLAWIPFAIFYCFVIATRSILTPDTIAYVNYYNSLNVNSVNFENSKFEIGFQLLTTLIKAITTSDYLFYFYLLALLNVVVIVLSIRNLYIICANEGKRIGVISYVFPLLLYISYFGILYNGIVLRAGLAISFVIYASTICYLNISTFSKVIKVFFFLVIACSFHRTSIIALLVFFVFLFTKEYSQRKYLCILLIIIIVYISNVGDSVTPFFIDVDLLTSFSEYRALDGISKINSYLVREGVNSGFSLKYSFFMLLGGFYICKPFATKIFYKYLNVFLCGMFIYAVFHKVDYLGRGLDFFLIYSFILSFLSLKTIKTNFFGYTVYVFILICQIILVMRIVNKI